MKLILAAAAFVLPLVTAGYAAAGPLKLTETQMDGVAAGAIGSATATATSLAIGGAAAVSQSATAASVQNVGAPILGLQAVLSQSASSAAAGN